MTDFIEDMPPIVPRQSAGPAPLTFAQQWWWNLYDAWGVANPSMRTVAMAFRAVGRFDLRAIHASLGDVARRHEALRTRIVMVDGSPMQEVDDAHEVDLNVSAVSGEREAKHRVESFMAQEVDLAVGPLFAARLFRIGPKDHVLALSMHILVGDGFSYDLLQREIRSGYFQRVRGLPPALPEVTAQLADYGVWQEETTPWWRNQHESYWNERLSTAPPLRFPIQEPRALNPQSHSVAVQLGTTASENLRAVSRTESTMPSMLLLALYSAALLRWQGKMDGVLVLIASGRHLWEIENTIGFFTSPLFLRIQLSPQDTFREHLSRVTREYCTALEHWDQGRLSASFPGIEFKRSASFNWQTRRADGGGRVTDPAQYRADVELRPFEFQRRKFVMNPSGVPETSRAAREDPDLSKWELQVSFEDLPGEIRGLIWYREDLYSAGSVERLVSTLHSFINTFLTRPDARILQVGVG